MQREKIVIDIKTDGAHREVSPMLYGIFFEDINYGGDGGLYAELVANRSFEYYTREVNSPEADATQDVHKCAGRPSATSPFPSARVSR